MAKVEVLCYLLRSFFFLRQVDPDLILAVNVVFIADLDSFCYRQNAGTFTQEHLSYKNRSQ